MSSQTERQHAEYLGYQLERHLRETLEQFGQTIEAQAYECRDELAFAMTEAGHHLASSVPALRQRLREHSGDTERGRTEAPPARGAEATRHRLPGSRVAVTRTMRGTGFVRPSNDPEPESAIPAEGRDSQAA